MREIIIANRVARTYLAGMLEAPPAMVDEISRWIRAMNASANIIAIEKDIKYYKGALKDIEEGRTNKMTEDKGQLTRNLILEEKNLKWEQREMSLFPGIHPENWNRKFKMFLINPRGWKYKYVIDRASPESIKEADKKYGYLYVQILRGTSGKASWAPDSNKLTIHGSHSWSEETLKHELGHWAQSYMDVLLGGEGKFGRPSTKMRNPDVHQNPDFTAILNSSGFRDVDFHSLDDVEFYTNLITTKKWFNRWMARSNIREQYGNNPKAFFKDFVGQNGDHYFTDRAMLSLRRNNRAKWNKAVKELYKAIF